MWQQGMVLEEDGATALVELIENRRIDITTWGDNKQEFANKLEVRIINLLKEYNFEVGEPLMRRIGKIVIREITIILARLIIGE
jgi:hypothetical protein